MDSSSLFGMSGAALVIALVVAKLGLPFARLRRQPTPAAPHTTSPLPASVPLRQPPVTRQRLLTRQEARSNVLSVLPDLSLSALESILSLYHPTSMVGGTHFSLAEIEHVIDGLLRTGYEKQPQQSSTREWATVPPSRPAAASLNQRPAPAPLLKPKSAPPPKPKLKKRDEQDDNTHIPSHSGTLTLFDPARVAWSPDEARSFVLTIVPDIERGQLDRVLLRNQSWGHRGSYARGELERTVDELFRAGYGTEEKKEVLEKEGEVGAGGGLGWCDVDWLDVERRNNKHKTAEYIKAAWDQIKLDYPDYTPATLDAIFRKTKLYALAFFATRKLIAANDKLMVQGKASASQLKKLRKAIAQNKQIGKAPQPLELQREIEWARERVAQEDEARRKAEEEHARAAAEEAHFRALDHAARVCGETVECCVCFESCSAQTVVCCGDGHPYCRDCTRCWVEDRLGSRQLALHCVSTEGCSSKLIRRQVAKFVPLRQLALLDQIQVEIELTSANLPGWELCPFCTEYGYCLDATLDEEPLFYCAKPSWGKTSCRSCKQLAHGGLSCKVAGKRAEGDSSLPGLHAVENAMSAALIRHCPNPTCKKPYVKSDGCNLIVCSSCHAQSCYLCRELVKGHDHFFDSYKAGARMEAGACALFDDTLQRNFGEVEAARKAALAGVGEGGVESIHMESLALDAPHGGRMM